MKALLTEDNPEPRSVVGAGQPVGSPGVAPIVPQLSARVMNPVLAVIVPTLNEVGNVAAIVDALDRALVGIDWEVIFVDDWSLDGTPEAIAGIAAARATPQAGVRLQRRFGRRGLSSAVVEGALGTTAAYIAVIDADGQHDETILPDLLAAVAEGRADIAVGTRYGAGGSIGEWAESRILLSKTATRLSRRLTRTPISDPMSGFFVMRQSMLVTLLPRLSSIGFKILFDILMSSPTPLKVHEVPYRFRNRVSGSSKLDTATAVEFVLLILDKLAGRWIPARLILFAAVGGFGLLVHLAILRLSLEAGLIFGQAQGVAVGLTIAVNFALNNQLTFRDRRLRGRALVRGLLSFYLICGLGAVANVGVGSVVYASQYRWWLAGLAGAAIGSIWNYAASSLLTWKQR